MLNLHTAQTAIFLLQLLVSAFLAILFLQSGLDKVTDRRGNQEWLTSHFAKSPFAGVVPLLLSALTILELGSGILSGIGFVQLLWTRSTAIAFYGAVLAAVTLIALFLGQRLAKDYPGAATLVPYFLLTLAAIYLLAQ